MKEKIVTHEDVLNDLEKKWPGFKKRVKTEADKLHIACQISEVSKPATQSPAFKRWVKKLKGR